MLYGYMIYSKKLSKKHSKKLAQNGKTSMIHDPSYRFLKSFYINSVYWEQK